MAHHVKSGPDVHERGPTTYLRGVCGTCAQQTRLKPSNSSSRSPVTDLLYGRVLAAQVTNRHRAALFLGARKGAAFWGVLLVDIGGLRPAAFREAGDADGRVGSSGTLWCSFVSRLSALPFDGVSVGRDREAVTGERARRRAARELIGAYHDEQLRGLLEHVREGFARLDGGEIDAFELDELIHRYKRSAQKLWSFCGSSGSAWEQAALTVEWWREQGEEEPDWWAAGEPRRRRE